MHTLIDTIELQNVVASTEVGQELNLEVVGSDLEGAEYNPDHFPGLVYRTSEPKAASLIFRSGKIVCTGANSEANVRAALNIVFADLRSIGVTVPESPKIEIQNIVASMDLDHRLNLNAIAIGLGLEHTEYEPEQFPGLVYRLEEPAVVALLFGSGKSVVTGAKTVEEIERATEVVATRLDELGLRD